ncbi:MAG: biotin/lipoyl-containing protein [Bacteroidota bacterium]
MAINKTYKRIYISVPAGEIYPFIPGAVLSYYVNVGDVVAKGDKLFVLQAMKMNNEVTSPISGTVKQINVKAGEKVSKNDVIMVVE